MKQLLLAEEAAQLLLGILALYFQSLHVSWWLWPLLILAPDISMLGYMAGTKTGAFTYNLFHHKLVAILLACAGYTLHNDALLFVGCLLFTHSCMDRVLGYGLKYPDNFQHTHLGWVGKARRTK
jgi:hypothetical protein